MDFKPSQYQEDIFEFTKYGYGNAVVSAVAGSGKSKTIVEALNYIKPDKKVLFLAFNNSIVVELNNKISRDNTDIKTTHSLGLSILRFNFKEKNLEVDEDKYKKKLNSILEKNYPDRLTEKKYIKNILKLCDLGRFYLIKTTDTLTEISLKYGILVADNETEIAFELISWAKESLNYVNTIDFTDMVYLPNVLSVRTLKYDFIFIDEAQDLSISQMALFLKCFKQGGRFIAVGDENQCINSFAGSDEESFNKLKSQLNTIELPLSISYRCPKNVITYAKNIVSHIEAKEDAIDGFIDFKSKIEDLKDGDLVICRNELPLIKLYAELISKEIKCHLKGIDIGLNLLYLIENTHEEKLNSNLKEIGVFSELYKSFLLYVEKNKIFNNYSDEDIVETQGYNDLLDKINCLSILSQGIKTKEELIQKIKNIFSDSETTGICLSTIHKAKGLEADNVYILNRNLIPSIFAKQGWELKQERNLEYVAYTRSKIKLGFIYDSNNMKIVDNKDLTKELNYIKNTTKTLYGET